MIEFKVIRILKWTSNSLRRKVEYVLNNEIEEGWEVVSVGNGLNNWFAPVAFITIKRTK